MKVAHILWSLRFGGIETMLVNIANLQNEKGIDVYVVIINDSYEKALIDSLSPGINLIKLGRKKASMNFTFIIKLNSILKKINPDVIHLHRSDISKILSPQILHKTCLTLHDLPKGKINQDGILQKFWSKITKRPIPYSNVTNIDLIPYIISISNSVQHELKSHYDISSIAICNGIKTHAFRKKSNKSPHTPLRIVMVSRLEHEKKGQDLLVEAISRLENKATVDFIGTGSSMSFLKEMVERLNCSHNIRFLGKQDQSYIATHLCEYDLFVQPSRWEGFGLTVAEAMAANVPVLVSEGQGPAEVTCGNKYGWVFSNGSVSDLTNKIQDLINNYEKASKKASEALDYVEKTFDIAITVNKYIETYKKIIDRNKRK